MLVNAADMLKKAEAGKYALGAFNTNNLEWTLAILQAAEEAKSPLILQCTAGAAKWMGGFKVCADMVKAAVEATGVTVPVALHLDHGSYEDCFKCIEAGFTSIMYDGSHEETFQLNLDRTKELVELAHSKGMSIEAEVGGIGGTEDGMTATFHLDPDAKFHDGTPVTANDWVFTAYLITDPNFDFGMKSECKFFEGTDDSGVRTGDTLGIEAVDDTTLVMTFKNPTPVEDWIMLHNKYFYVLPEHLLGDMDPAEVNASDIWDNPNDLGSGPCTYISELSGSQLELGSFADYQLGAPKFGKLVYTVISASNTVTSVMTGELDMFIQSASIEDSLAAQDMGLPVQQSDLPTSVVVFLINNQNVSDKRIRQAMNLAIDKEMLIEQNVEGQGVPSATYIIPGSEYDAGIEWSRDVEGAKALLEEAGWDSSQTLTMAVTSTRERMAAVIQQNLAEVGINIEILTVDLATEFAGLQDGTYDLGICGSTATNYPLWMEGYYDYRDATYCQIPIRPSPSIRNRSLPRWMRPPEKNWSTSTSSSCTTRCLWLCFTTPTRSASSAQECPASISPTPACSTKRFGTGK